VSFTGMQLRRDIAAGAGEVDSVPAAVGKPEVVPAGPAAPAGGA